MPDYDVKRQQWMDNGSPLSADAVIAEIRHLQDASETILMNLTNQVYAGQITLEQWQIASASVLKDMHLAQTAFGAGGKKSLTPAELARVEETLKKEYTFLRDFAVAVAAGLSLAMALNRILMYAIGSQQSYWWSLVHSLPPNARIIWTLHPAEHCQNCLDLAAGSPYTPANLPTVPGAGATECLSYCKCTLEIGAI
jgi:hypothetical protein